MPDAGFDEVFALVMSARAREPATSVPGRLRSLFHELELPEPPRPADEIEELIWAHWIANPDERAASAMATASQAMASGRLGIAGPLLDHLAADHPDWPEAWNKRATLAFIQKRDMDALANIARTLALEPRHFGAMAGFGQICLRHGRKQEARAAFQVALAVNPHLQGLPELIEELGKEIGRAN
jgi:predicted Zn-dependent protease